MSKVALDFAPAFVGQQLRPLLPAGVDFDALQAQTDTELARCAHDADVLVSTRTHIDAHTLRLVPAVRFIQQLGIGYEHQRPFVEQRSQSAHEHSADDRAKADRGTSHTVDPIQTPGERLDQYPGGQGQPCTHPR